MVATCRLGKGLLALGIGLAIGGLLGEESWGQPGGGFDGDGGGGMGGGRGRGGRGSLRPRPRGPFGDMHWEAQLLLRENREVLRYLPPPVRVYMFTALKDWDNLFLPERKRVRVFFRKAVLDGPEGVTKAFQKVLPPAAPQGSQGGRGGRMAWQAFAQPHLLARVADALDRYVQDEMAFAPALVIIAITGDKAPSDSAAFPDSLAAQGTLLKHVRFDVEPRRWLAALLAGREDGLKGRKLAYPSIFEYHNRGWEDKTHARTLAFAIDDKQFPAPSSAKGYGKKYGPGLVRASDFEYAAQFIRDRLVAFPQH